MSVLLKKPSCWQPSWNHELYSISFITTFPYNRRKDLEDFDNNRASVKGLVDAGMKSIPKIFVWNSGFLAGDRRDSHRADFEIPALDLLEVNGAVTSEEVPRVLRAAVEVGFFHVVNHGTVMELTKRMLEVTCMFHKMPSEEKAEYYSREGRRKVKYFSNFDLYELKYVNWRDTLFCLMDPHELSPLNLPPLQGRNNGILETCRRSRMTLLEALGLERDYLKNMECTKGHAVLCHYYPVCPEPHLTMGTTRHTDPTVVVDSKSFTKTSGSKFPHCPAPDCQHWRSSTAHV